MSERDHYSNKPDHKKRSDFWKSVRRMASVMIENCPEDDCEFCNISPNCFDMMRMAQYQEEKNKET